MNSIALIERINSTDVIEKEWNQFYVFLSCYFAINGIVSGTVLLTHAWRHHHSGENYFCSRVKFSNAVYHADQILFCFGRRQTAQTVVGTEFQNENGHILLFQNPIYSAQSGGRRLTGNPGIYYGVREI